MNKSFFKIGLGLLALAGVVWPSRGAVTGMKTLSGHVPAVVSQLAAAGDLPATNSLYLSIGLPLRNQDGVTNLLQQLYDPASPSYRHFLTPEEFTAEFGPTTNDYQAVINFAAANGLTVVQTHPNRMLVDVLAKVPDVERAFHVKMKTFHHPFEARDFYAPTTEPSVDATLPILAVQGMNNYSLPHSMLHKRPASLPQPSTGSGPFGGLMGQDFRNAYVPGSPLTGAGQTVGLLQFDGYFASDIQTYESVAGLPNVSLKNVLLDGFNGVPGVNNGEVCLDIEMTLSMAPGVGQVMVFEAGPFGNPDDILNSMAASNQVKVLSSSWGYSIDPTTPQIYIQFALQGQTYLNCSGDGDAWTTNGVEINGSPQGSAENQFVTVVGGTTLTMSGFGNSYLSEQAWNWGNVGDFGWNPDGFAGTSGGISTDVPIPFYQAGINTVNNHASTVFRNVPDVALTADNVFIVADGGAFEIIGGTSAATPLWAGLTALLNQQAVANGERTFGFLAPILYSLAKTTNYALCFHDITTGSNTWDQSLTNYYAVPGYDLCTGLGTPIGTSLINTLTGTNGIPPVYVPPTPIIPAPIQPWGSTLSVMDGANPNGLWLLYIQDDTAPTGGVLYNGWAVNLTTANPVGLPADNLLAANTTVNSLAYGNATNVIATPGALWHTTLSVTNYGPSISSNVIVTVTLPATPGVTLVSSNTSMGSVLVTQDGGLLIWNVTTNNVTTNSYGMVNTNTMAVGGTGRLTLNFMVNYTGIYTNAATVSSDTMDPNPDDDSVEVIATVAVTTPPSINPHFVLSSGHSLQLTVTNDAGATMIIQASTNLISWVPVFTNISPFTFTNYDSTNFPQRFYRAVTSP